MGPVQPACASSTHLRARTKAWQTCSFVGYKLGTCSDFRTSLEHLVASSGEQAAEAPERVEEMTLELD